MAAQPHSVQPPSVLLVDDETAITDNLAPFLRRAGFRVGVAGDGSEALQQIRRDHPDLVVLDVLLPGVDGRAVLRTARAEGHRVPVILLTQVGESAERAMALDEGADDYLNKPFDPHELVARLRAVLRRTSSAGRVTGARRLRAGDLELDRAAHRVFHRGSPVELTPRATILLAYLMTHPDEVLGRERLLEAVWGWNHPVGTRAVDTRVAELRRALDDDPLNPRYIATVTGLGYRFAAPVDPA